MRKPKLTSVRATAYPGEVRLMVGSAPLHLTSQQADELGLELVRKSDVSRTLARMAGRR